MGITKADDVFVISLKPAVAGFNFCLNLKLFYGVLLITEIQMIIQMTFCGQKWESVILFKQIFKFWEAQIMTFGKNGLTEGKCFKGGINIIDNLTERPEIDFEKRAYDIREVLSQQVIINIKVNEAKLIENAKIINNEIDEEKQEVRLTVSIPLELFDKLERFIDNNK